MKIVVAGPVGGRGGLQTHYEELLNFLKKDGHEVSQLDVYISNEGYLTESYTSEAKKFGIGFGGGGKGFRRINKLFDWIRAAMRLRSLKPEILVSISNGYGYAFLGLLAPRNCFCVRTEVTDSWKKGAMLHEIMARAYHATAVQSPALMTAQKKKISVRQSLAVLPCFSRMDVNHAIAKKPNSDEILRLAFFGRLAQNKGLIELLTLLPSLRGQLNIRIDIWGEGVVRGRLENLILEKNLKEIVELKGPYPGEALSSLLASYHGLILPSQYSEGLPLVLLEAASVGLPFLSCDIGAIKDCEYDNPDCLVVQPDKKSLHDGIILWCNRLRTGEIDPNRLKSWFFKYHSRTVYEHIWRSMLKERHRFFNE